MRWPAWTYSPGSTKVRSITAGTGLRIVRSSMSTFCWRELGFEVRGLMIEGRDLRIDHAQPVVLDPRLVEAALGLLVLGLELQDLAFELGHRGLRHLELALADHAALEQRPVALELELRQVEIGLERGQRLFANRDGGGARAVSASVWFSLSRRSASSLVRSALTPSICARRASERSLATRSSMRVTTWPAATRVPSSAGISITQPSARLETVTMSAVARASYS